MVDNDTQPVYGIDVWGAGFTSGLVAGILMGLVLHLGANLIELLGGLAPVPAASVFVGWTIHLALSVVFGLVFAVAVTRAPIRERVNVFGDYVVAGLLYAALLGLFAGGVLFPLAMDRAGIVALPVPFLPVPGLAAELFGAVTFAVGHLVYGLVLGSVFAAINGVVPDRIGGRVRALER